LLVVVLVFFLCVFRLLFFEDLLVVLAQLGFGRLKCFVAEEFFECDFG
jgi:hypothetical protein